MNKQTAISKINPLILQGICHRGLHNKDFTENGMGAFKNALEHNMAFELDVHLTKDNELIVMHDHDLKRTTGKKGIIEEITLKEIKENYRLHDGGEVPTFKEVLDLINEQVPIVTELKVHNKNYKALAERVKKELQQIKDKKNIMLISFDPRALIPFKNEGFIRQLLVTIEKQHRYTYHFRHLFEGVDLNFHFLDEIKVRRYCQRHFTNIWTIRSAEDLNKYLDYTDTVTFENIDPEYVKRRLSEKQR